MILREGKYLTIDFKKICLINNDDIVIRLT
jgi:hypothetical protein